MSNQCEQKGAIKPPPRAIESLTSSSLFTAIAGALALAISVGCTATTTGKAANERCPIRSAPELVQPLKKPAHMQAEFGWPYDVVRSQSFHWDKYGLEWTVLMPPIDDAHAGVMFRRELDLSGDKSTKWLSFQFKPADMAQHIEVALLEHCNNRDAQAILATSLDAYEVGSRADWGYYLIPLEDFDHVPENIDWTNIRALKLTRLADEAPQFQFVLKQLEFQNRTYRVPAKYAYLR